MMICSNAMLDILGKGRMFWETCRQAVITNEAPCHGLKAKVSNNGMDPESSLFLSLHFFFDEMEELAEPRATRLGVREETNNGLRGDNETLDLPAWTTKRELYRRWCYEQGWILQTTDMSNWRKVARVDDEQGMFLLCVLLSCS
jgi:hypothetical protein